MGAERGSWLDLPWRAFAKDRETPTVFRGVVREPFVSPKEAFDALLAARAPSSGDDVHAAPTLRLYDGAEVPVDDAMLPSPADRSIPGYVRRLERTLREPAVVANFFQAGSARVFGRSLDVLEPLYERIGLPTGGALLDLFAGRYRRSPLGVHKDEQDVFTFVLHGTKRFLVWPFERLARRFGVRPSARRLPWSLEDADVDALRAEATVLEAGPNDVVFWPASAWHLAESDGELAVTIALGIFPRRAPLFLVERAVRILRIEEDTRAFSYDADTVPFVRRAPSERRVARMRKAALGRVTAELADAHELAFETWRSAFGYRRVPPPLARFSLSLDDVVQVPAPAMLASVERNEQLFVCAGGHVLPLVRHSRVAALLALVGDGREHSVRMLVRRFARGSRAGEPDLDAGAIVWVLGFLGRSHALRKCARRDRRS